MGDEELRARNIKPGFFKNETLADGGPCAQLLFEGLWCLADRDGRLEDRPRRIKVEVFPYYDPKPGIDTLLKFLTEKGFIRRYKNNKLSLIQICNFKKHQSPHHTEKTSTYPPPEIHENPPEIHESLTVNSRKSNGEYPSDSLIHGFTDSLIEDSGASPDGESTSKPKKIDDPIAYTGNYYCLKRSSFEKLRKLAAGFDDSGFETILEKLDMYVADNPRKYKRNADGTLANPSNILIKWLQKETPNNRGGPGQGEPKGFEALRHFVNKRGGQDA